MTKYTQNKYPPNVCPLNMVKNNYIFSGRLIIIKSLIYNNL